MKLLTLTQLHLLMKLIATEILPLCTTEEPMGIAIELFKILEKVLILKQDLIWIINIL